jgi:hypothetical protein
MKRFFILMHKIRTTQNPAGFIRVARFYAIIKKKIHKIRRTNSMVYTIVLTHLKRKQEVIAVVGGQRRIVVFVRLYTREAMIYAIC